MTDKEKIRKEVQRLMNELIQEKEKGYGSDVDDASILELQNVLTYINSLNEEPVSIWHNMDEVPIKGEVIVVQTKDTFYGLSVQKGGTTYKNKNKDRYIKWAYASDLLNLSNVERTVKNWKEEPVSRTPTDIEAAMQEVEEKSKAFTEAYQGESFYEILAWMRGEEPVSEDLEEASRKYADNEEYGDDVYFAIKAAFKAGAQWQKEQMIKDAVYGLVCGHDESSPAWIDLNLLNKPNIKVGTEVKLIIIKDE